MKLDDWLKKEHSLPERLRVVAGLCSALDDAHRRSVVRGGLEPAGIDVGTDGSCRLDSDPPRAGSPYAAPELAEGGPPTSKGEIYSAGMIGYEVLSGRPLFDSDPPRPLQDLRPDLPRDLTDAVTACLERDPEWRPADLAYLLAVVQSLQNEAKAAATPPSTPTRRVNPPPRAILEVAPRKRWDDRSALTRALPVVLVAVAIVGTGGAWLWFEVSRPSRKPAGGIRSAAPSIPPTTLAQNAAASVGSPSAPTPSVLPTRAAAPPSSLAATPSVAPLASPRTPASSGASSPNPRPSATPPPLTTTAAAPPPAPASPPEAPRPLNPQPTPEPSLPEREEPAAGAAAQALVGPATIRAIAPFRLRAGSLHVLDVHGAGLRADHRARIVPQKRREPEAGFAVTRYQLRNPSLLLVFLQVDAAVRPGRYAFSLVDASGVESNAFTIEISAR